jgi:YVTN family beta-propeller protein
MPKRPLMSLAAAAVGAALLSGCSGHKSVHTATGAPTPSAAGPSVSYLTGVPENTDPRNVYAADGAGMLDPKVKDDPALVYVPNTESDTVSVIDPATYKVVRTFPVGHQPQHVSPTWDLSVLWVEDDLGNELTPVDPRTGRVGKPVPVEDPYNLYFTPDGTRAVVMAEAQRRMDFRDAHTMAVRHRMPVPCNGLNHMDFSVDGRIAVASCEFDGSLLRIDMTPGAEKVLGRIVVGGAPQDVKLSPDGSLYYVADMNKNGVHVIDAAAFREIAFIPTGKGAHGLYPSRDGTKLYVSNRMEGSISVIDFASRRLVAKWIFDGGHGSPDMGGVSADGKILWLSGRYDGEVYAISTETGKLVVPPIKVGRGPHGACVWPQPGRYSMGHTGNMR